MICSRVKSVCVFLLIFVVFAGVSYGQEPSAPPLPVHGIEGYGGLFGTYSAYVVNPAKEGELFGKPSVGYTFVNMGQDRYLHAFTITETIGDRLELGYGYDLMDVGDLPEDIFRTTGGALQMDDDLVGLHNFNLRFQVLKEGDYDLKYLPAVTAGIHYKYNDTYRDINSDLMGTLRNIGVEDEDGIDFTLYASKLFTELPRPLLINAGLRITEGAHIGLLGFTDEYNACLEASAFVFVTDALIVGGEFRQKPEAYAPIRGLVEDEDDWWTVCACYLLNSNLTLATGYGHFGHVLNHEANGVWGASIKWEF